MKKNKKKYIPPTLEVISIEMEQGIAAGSATLNPGDSNSLNTPQVEELNDGGTIGGGSNDFDI